MPAIKISSKGKVFEVLFDEEDRALVEAHRWCVAHAGRSKYAVTSIKTLGGVWRMARMHKMIAGTPEGLDTDHRNGNGLDNRRRNLRVCSRADNIRNQRLHASSSTGFRGVTRKVLPSGSVRFRAHIRVLGVQRHLGYFATAEAASRAYDAAADSAFGEFARPSRDE